MIIIILEKCSVFNYSYILRIIICYHCGGVSRLVSFSASLSIVSFQECCPHWSVGGSGTTVHTITAEEVRHACMNHYKFSAVMSLRSRDNVQANALNLTM